MSQTVSLEEMEHLNMVLASGAPLSQEDMKIFAAVLVHGGPWTEEEEDDDESVQIPLTDGLINKATQIYETYKNDSVFVNGEFHSAFVLGALAHDINSLFQKMWWTIDTNVTAKKSELESAWNLYVSKGMEGLLRNCAEISDDNLIIQLTWFGIAGWLEDKTVSNILFALMRIKGHVTRDSLETVESRLGENRFKKMSAFLEGIDISD